MADLPSSDERTVIIGATGSGKTQFAVWLLSTRNFHQRPWFILDYKGEKLFSEIALTPWNFSDPWPIEPGLYWIKILPGEDEQVSQFFQQAYLRGNVGIYTDEGYMLPYQDRWVRACLTQGRSKNIEMITLTQRPVRLDVFFFSEASYFSVFNLNVKEDKKRVSEFMDGLTIKRLPKYHSLWFDVGEQEATYFKPVPPAEQIIQTFLDFEQELEEKEELDASERRIIAL